MVANIEPADWSAKRGEAWRDSMRPLEAMLAPVNAPLLNALELNRPYRIADIGCGGGETSIAVARNAMKGSFIEGFDISPALIEAASAKSAGTEVPVQFQVADAQEPLPAEAKFDRLTSRFGIMFFPNQDIAFRNLANWLKPGGQFAFAVWGPPAENPWMTSLRDVVGAHVDLPSPEPTAPGPFRYQDVDMFATLLEQSGFADLRSTSWTEDLAIGGGLNAAAATEFALTAFAIGQNLNDTDPVTAQAARNDLTSLFSKHEHAGEVRMAAHVRIVTGKRSA